MAEQIERLSWPEFVASFRWEQGEHVSLIGPTGQGKTIAALALLGLRQYVTIVSTKAADPVMEALLERDRGRRRGYRRIGSWPPPAHPSIMPRVVLWPPYRGKGDVPEQAAKVEAALDAMFREGRWCIYVDELYYLCHFLGLAADLELIWTQGRSHGVSLVGSTQRPAWVPLFMYSAATHVFFFRHNDEADAKRIANMNAGDPRTIRDAVRSLGQHEFLYVDTRTGRMCRSKVGR